MQVEVSLVVAGLSLLLSAYLGINNLKKSNKKDVADDTMSITTVIVKLENISNNISEIKADMRQINIDEKNQSLKIAKMEQQIKALEKSVFANRTTMVEGAEIYHEN